VDTLSNAEHCGRCNSPCSGGASCSAGSCRGTPGSDGCGAPALGLNLTQLAVYQSIKIPVMSGGQAVDPGVRTAPVIVGRQTLFRAFVELEAGFAARELSARLTLVNGATSDAYFSKKVVSRNSTDADPATTFQIAVPADKIGPDTRYALQVVECAAGSGSALASRFPAAGDVPLGTRSTGSLKVRVVPVSANGRLPDTSQGVLGVYRDYLMAMYPVSAVEIEVAPSIGVAYPLDWAGMLDQLRARRVNDTPASEVYYYGLVRPAETFAQYCGRACTAGIGYVATTFTSASARTAVGIAFADQASAETMAHELGHTHGRNHAPCAPGGNISGVDRSFPHSGALIGVWGYDSRSRVLHDPSRVTDIMGYCNQRWVSDYTYRALIERVASVNGALRPFAAERAVARFRVLLLDALGPRWGVPFDRPAAAEGAPQLIEIVDANGQAVASVTGYRTEIADLDAASVLVPEPEPGWHAVRVPGWPALPFAAPQSVPQP
jgi:hypothetical protein